MVDSRATRERLPNRRASELFDFIHDNLVYTVELSRYADGRVAEIFVDGEKVDSSTDIAMRDSAIVLSIAFQHGLTIADILPALTRGHDERPLGPMGKLLEMIQAMDAPGVPVSEGSSLSALDAIFDAVEEELDKKTGDGMIRAHTLLGLASRYIRVLKDQPANQALAQAIIAEIDSQVAS